MLSKQKNEIAKAILKEIRERLGFLNNVGLEYLTLSRNSGTLSGGESQRIRLASQIGSGLTGVLYVLDEPSIGLHQRDNGRLLTTLKNLRDQGNTVIVVEHDEEAIREADYVFDIGPGAGVHGGQITAKGTPEEVAATPNSITGEYLTGKREIAVPKTRRKGNGKKLTVKKATGNNLQNVTADFPLGQFVCVTGVSGGGKSTLTIETLFKTASMRLNGARQTPAPCETIQGLEQLDKVIDIDQRPIGRTPRSNPATYTGAGLPRRRRHQDRNALPARCLRHLRNLQWRALQPRNFRGQIQRQKHCRRAGYDRRGRAGFLQGGAVDPVQNGCADAGGAWLYQGRPAGHDALRRGGAAGEAFQGAGQILHRLVAKGTPEKVAQVEGSYTGHYLKDMLTPKKKIAAE